MHTLNFVRRLLLAAALPAVASAATWTVGPVGSGADFNSIQAAIDAASPGDTLLIYYSSPKYGPFVVDKPLRLIGQGFNHVIVQGTPAPGEFSVAQVRDIPAGQEVVIAGLGLRGSGPAWTATPSAPLLDVRNNAGRVVLHRVAASDTSGSVFESVARIEGSDFVVLSACNLDAVSAAPLSAPALRIDQSTVWMTSGIYRGGRAFSTSAPVAGADAVIVEDSTLRATNAVLTGGRAGSLPGPCPGDGPGPIGLASGDALDVRGHSVVEIGGTATLILTAGAVLPGAQCQQGEVGAALRMRDDAQVTLQTSTLVQGAIDVAPTATLQLTSELTPVVQVIPGMQEIYLGSLLELVVTGAPGSLAWIFAAPTTALPFTLPGIQGAAALDPVSAVLVSAKIIDLTQQATAQIGIPNDPNLIGACFAFQVAQYDGTALRLGLVSLGFVAF
jgi:hypothetical protein